MIESWDSKNNQGLSSPILRVVCWLKTILMSCWNFAHVSGHRYVEEVPETEAIVHVLKCADCEHTSIGWTRRKDYPV